MNLKEEFDEKFVGISYDKGDIWDWITGKIGDLQKETSRLNKAIEEIKGTAGVCSDAEVGEYGLYEYCEKIQNESNFTNSWRRNELKRRS